MDELNPKEKTEDKEHPALIAIILMGAIALPAVLAAFLNLTGTNTQSNELDTEYHVEADDSYVH